MELLLSANIGKLRRAHGMTQEQLAEALGVTFASVSKWERGAATPDLRFLTEMADLFGVSLDAIVGFEVRDGSAAALKERIKLLQRGKKYEEGIAEAEKALLRYPNMFLIVFSAGGLYTAAGIEQKNETYLRRSIELLERSVLLLPQNTDPEIDEAVIQKEIAQCYLSLGQPKQAIEILKKHNVGGLYHSLIAAAYTQNDVFDPREAEPYLMGAFGEILASAVQTMLAYANYYFKTNDTVSSLESVVWLVHLLESVKMDLRTVAYVDKVLAVCYCECANLSLLLGERETGETWLRRAFDTAKSFDEAPTYKIQNIKFCVGNTKQAIIYDDLGKSAMASVEKQILEEDRNEPLRKLWEEIQAEEEAAK